MIRNERERRNRSLVVEGLESRALLNAAVPALSVAEIHALKAPKATTIKGTIHAQVTSRTPLTANGLIVLVNYSGQGNATLVGSGQATGQHIISSVPGKKLTSDTYSNGSATLTTAGIVIDATYTGAGHTTTKTGKSIATLRGTATDVQGVDAGLSGSFVASLSGNSRTGAFTITFSIRV